MDSVLILLLVGLVAGGLSGLIGVGGGILLTPVLHFGFQVPWVEAVLVSLLVIAIQSPIGIWSHAKRASIQWRTLPLLLGGGLVGVLVAAWTIDRIPVTALRLAFAALLALMGLRFLGRELPIRTAGPTTLALLGLLAGLVSRWLGVGGGLLTTPGLTALGVRPVAAVGTSLVIVFVNALAGVLLAIPLQVALGVWLPAALGAVVGAPLGARVAHGLPDVGLRRVVGTCMVLGAGLIALVSLVGVR